jgi:hypothetical protein
MAREPELDESKFLRHYMYGSTQREGFRELWETWKKRWGEVQAADALLISMCEFEANFQDHKRFMAERRKKRGRK